MMGPMQSGSKFTDRIIKYLTKSTERKTTRASKSKGHVISSVALTSVVMKSFEQLVLAHLKDITGTLLDPLQFA